MDCNDFAFLQLLPFALLFHSSCQLGDVEATRLLSCATAEEVELPEDWRRTSE
jgi:hypothetical protein